MEKMENQRDKDNSKKNSENMAVDDIVISGFSGRLPESSNMEEFKRNLFDGVDMVNDDPRRWPHGFYDLPTRIGKIKDIDLESFDLQFFGVHTKQAEYMDPQLRMLLETTYEAIVDAGINPQDLRGSRTGVYIGCSYSDVEDWCSDPDRQSGFGVIGCYTSMFSNRISFAFDLRGPSVVVDTACSSSLFALAQGYQDIKMGKCDYAIVGGVSVILKASRSLQFMRLGMLSLDGTCRTFCQNGTGYVRSDGCVVLVLQKAHSSKRVYASVMNARTNSDGYKKEGITYPNGQMQHQLIKETYEEINLDPFEVEYIEAHGTGTKVGDPQEINAITDYFCKNRKSPLLIGSVKSNMGHSEPASGVCSIAKVLLAMESGLLPGNLHYQMPNEELYGILDGRLKVVDKNLPWNCGIVGVNSFGFGGANAHVVLKSNPKRKIWQIPVDCDMPRLVLLSGRTEDGLQNRLGNLKEEQTDTEYLGLLNEIYSKNIPFHYYRGFTILDNTSSMETRSLSKENRPIWYVYPGMGCQWASMGKELMNFKVCQNAIVECAKILKAEGFDLIDLLTKSDESQFDNVLNACVGITSVQIALTDLMSDLKIAPDGLIGHSIGELACAYADGCFTLEQTILTAYWRGKCILDGNLPAMLMVSVGLSWKDCIEIMPEDVYTACSNSDKNVTISGPIDSIKNVVAELVGKGIFAKIVNSSGVAFHSRYLDPIKPALQKCYDQLIPNPKRRSSRWLSTSVRECYWNTEFAQHSSSGYHVNNVLSPVWFHETIQYIPKDAICIEIGPHGLLQALLRYSLGKEVINISLWKRFSENNTIFLLTSIGRLYNAGAQPHIKNLYPTIQYPVGRGTPMINSKIDWDHSQRFSIPKLLDTKSVETLVKVSLSNDEYLAGHIIDGRNIFPATGYIALVWQTYAKLRQTPYDQTSIIFEDVVFHRPIILSKENPIQFSIKIFDGSGKFEICENNSLTMSGSINMSDKLDGHRVENCITPSNNPGIHLNATDIYKSLRLCGYDYDGLFKGILQSDLNLSHGKLQWHNNWISFMDTMLQFSILGNTVRQLLLPTRIQKIIIDPIKHVDCIDESTNTVPIWMHQNINVIKSGAIEVHGLKFSSLPRRSTSQTAPIHERFLFLPFKNVVHQSEKEDEVLQALVQIVIENNCGVNKFRIGEVDSKKMEQKSIALRVQNIIENEAYLVSLFKIDANYMLEVDEKSQVIRKTPERESVENDCHLLIAYDILSSENILKTLSNFKASINKDGFIMLEETMEGCDQKKVDKICMELELIKVAIHVQHQKIYILLRPAIDMSLRQKEVIYLTENSYNWLEQLKRSLATAEAQNRYIYLVAQDEEYFGAVGLMNCVKNENGGKYVRLVFIEDKNVVKFSFDNLMYAEQLRSNLIMNVFRQSAWGSYRYLQFDTTIDSLKSVEHAYVNASTMGDLSILKWIESPLSLESPHTMDDNVDFCTVYYAPINFKDVMIASGKLSMDGLSGDQSSKDCFLGLEFSGRSSSGKRIMALTNSKSLATTCAARTNMIWEIPDHWTMESASTIPCVYSTAYYALVVRGQIKKGESILIHAGSGGVGQAAISVALYHGLTVYTTVGSIGKRNFLKEIFPQLTDHNIGNSRDTSFEEFILEATNGKGVDLILNSLAEEKLQASVRCLGINGRFLEIGKIDMSSNNPLGMSVFLKNTTFHGIHLDRVMEGNDEIINQIVGLVSDGILNGAVRPLRATIFTESEVEKAFRFMASGKHIGKVVIKIRDEEDHGLSQRTPKSIKAIPRTYLHNKKSYVIVGGLGGFGLELCDWMISRGARNIVLTSRSGIKNGYQMLMVNKWRKRGINIISHVDDIESVEAAKILLKDCSKIGPVGGIFNLAAVIRDNHLENQMEDDFRQVCHPKVNVTKYLDQASRELCSRLDHFICFSSVCSGRGNIGQTNYGLANSTMERICENRQASGFAGKAIQWGAIADIGLILEIFGNNEIVVGRTLPQRLTSCLDTIDLFMQNSFSVVCSRVIAEKCKTDELSTVHLIDHVAGMLDIKDFSSIPEQTCLVDLGMDSLIVAELRQSLECKYDIVLSPQEIRQLSIGKLKTMDLRAENIKHISNEAIEQISESDPVTSHLIEGDAIFSTELMPTQTLIRIPSKVASDSNKLSIFVIHAIEGFIDSLKPLASLMNCTVWGLQCTPDAPLSSIRDLAKFYVEKIREVQPNGPYNIVGYSFGVAVAFEMVVCLENGGETTKLFMIDGSPSYIKWYTNQIKHRTDDAFKRQTEDEAHILAYFGMMCIDLDYAQMAKKLVLLPSYESRLYTIASTICKNSNFVMELVLIAAQSFYNKIIAAGTYEPNTKVKTQNVILVKPSKNYVELPFDYGLSKHCTNDIAITTINGDHRTVLTGSSVNKIAEILDKFIRC